MPDHDRQDIGGTIVEGRGDRKTEEERRGDGAAGGGKNMKDKGRVPLASDRLRDRTREKRYLDEERVYP